MFKTREEARSKAEKEKDFFRLGKFRSEGMDVGEIGTNDHRRNNRGRWRSISGFDESAERPISRRSTIKKEWRLARALKIFKIVCQAELQPRSGPPLPPRSPANGVTERVAPRGERAEEERADEDGYGGDEDDDDDVDDDPRHMCRT